MIRRWALSTIAITTLLGPVGCGASGAGQAMPAYASEGVTGSGESPKQEDAVLEDSAREEGAESDQESVTSLADISTEEETIALGTLEGAGTILDLALKRLDELHKTDTAMESDALSTSSTQCVQACKALSSLRRAADAICRLAGEKTRRCENARQVVRENEQRVSACQCEAE